MAVVEVRSEVTGNVWKIEKAVGDSVAAEDVVMILESMKMEIPVESPVDGVVAEIRVQPDDQVEEDQVLAVVSA